MKKKQDKLSEAITQQDLRSSQEDIYSSEERAKIEIFLDLVEDFVQAIYNQQKYPGTGTFKELGVSREALVKGIEDNL